MKKINLLLFLISVQFYGYAQQGIGAKKTATEKAVEKSKKINAKMQEINEASKEIANQATEAANNAKTIVANAKTVLKIFEPILSFHFKKNKKKTVNNKSPNTTNNENTNTPSQIEPQLLETENTNTQVYNNDATATQSNEQTNTVPTNGSSNYANYGIPENDTYNSDGTMNMGHQNNGKYGNSLNLLEAKVMGMGEAEESPAKIDLIFFSQYGGLGYSFQSPFEAPTINEGVSIKSWRERNETEIAETKLTIGQFEKMTTNISLVNAVKNTKGFGGSFFTPNKMDGRVFAIKLQQDTKEVFALLAVYKQYGTAGSNGYLQIKIKVQGLDNNKDGYPDTNEYTRQ